MTRFVRIRSGVYKPADLALLRDTVRSKRLSVGKHVRHAGRAFELVKTKSTEIGEIFIFERRF